MRKIITILVIGIFLVTGAVTPSAYASRRALTNVEFAELVARTIGAELPAGSEDLPDLEYFEVLSNVLASSGVYYFVGKNANDAITAGDLAKVLYLPAGGTEAATTYDKLQFLIEGGYIPSINVDSKVSLAYVTGVLNDPEFSALIAEAYHPVTEEQRRNPSAPGVIDEEGVSVI